MTASFTWFEKFGSVIDMLPEDKRDTMKLAIVDYGAWGIWPDLEQPYDAIFESMRDDIDHSIKMRNKGRKGNSKRWNGEGSDDAE